MTHVLLVNPITEQIIHNIPIYENSDVKKVQEFVKDKEKDGEVVRILFSLGSVQVMDPKDQIPIPLQSLPRGRS